MAQDLCKASTRKKPNLVETVQVIQPHIVNDGYLTFSWKEIDWACYYEIEYLYCDDYGTIPGSRLEKSKIKYDFRFNSTRIQVQETKLEVPLVFESGYLVFRVRPLTIWGKYDQQVIGKWSLPDAGALLDIGDYYYKIDSNLV
ncbi:MAG: hypothetical protein ACK56I_21070, partial [bacterium]